MKVAIYTHHQPSRVMLEIIQRAVQGASVITNFNLPVPHTKYTYEQAGKASGAIWGEVVNPSHSISMDDFPFDWMQMMAKPAGIIASLARDSDRIMLMFPASSEIPPIYLLVAMLYSKYVRVYCGTTPVDDITTRITSPLARKQYETLVLPTLESIPIPTDLLQTPSGATLRPYQQQMVNFGLTHPYSGWFVDMGLGKTLATLALLDEWIKRGEIDTSKPVLIVAPIMVAKDTWGREVKKWGYDWDVKINIRLTPKKREKLLLEMALPQARPTLLMTNPHQLEAIRNFYYAYNQPIPFEVLIVDELSMFKSPTAKRNDVIQHYRRVAKKFLGLTGTPSPNNLLDVWNQLKLIDRNNTGWAKDNIYQFQDAFFTPVLKTPQGAVRKWKPKFGAENTIYRHLSKSVISMCTKGLVDLPPIVHSTLHIELPERAMREYHTLETEIGEKVEQGGSQTYTTDDGFSLNIPNNDVLRAKLLQIAGGALYTDPKGNQYDVFHDEKLEALDELIETSTSPILVFYYFKSDIARIQKRHKNNIAVLDSKDANVQSVIERWNAGDIPVLLAHPASVGHGLNLQDGGHTIVWFTLPNWNNDIYTQANKRLHRSGQTQSVSVVHLIAKNTIEEVMLQSLRAKTKTNDSLMDALDTMERA